MLQVEKAIAALPRIYCPDCGSRMRLARVQPDIDREQADVSMFVCDCGCAYRHTLDRRAQ